MKKLILCILVASCIGCAGTYEFNNEKGMKGKANQIQTRAGKVDKVKLNYWSEFKLNSWTLWGNKK